MLLEVDENNICSLIVNKNSSASRPVVVHPSGIVFGVSLYDYALGGKPLLLFLVESRQLSVLPVYFAKHFHYFLLNLEFGFDCHERSEGSALEVSLH